MTTKKYNPEGKDLTKGKMVQKVGYVKGTSITELDKVVDILQNGGQADMISQEVLNTGVQVMTVKIYFQTPKT